MGIYNGSLSSLPLDVAGLKATVVKNVERKPPWYSDKLYQVEAGQTCSCVAIEVCSNRLWINAESAVIGVLAMFIYWRQSFPEATTGPRR